jgi:hypothetical protein
VPRAPRATLEQILGSARDAEFLLRSDDEVAVRQHGADVCVASRDCA